MGDMAWVHILLDQHIRARHLPRDLVGSFDPNCLTPGPDFTARADSALDALADGGRTAIKQHMGIWRDLRVKRRTTEIDVLVGVLVAAGREAGIATPVNATLLDLVHAIERGECGMEWENLRTIATQAGLSLAV